RTLLNNNFEGYKLSFTPSPELQHIVLPERATQSRFGINARGFQEVASRVRHNHLAVGEGAAIYIAERGDVVLVRMIDGQDGLSIHVVFHLPDYLSDSVVRVHAEYPAAAYLAQYTWLLSDGHGTAYLIRIDDNEPMAHLLASWELQVDNMTVPCPFQLQNATVVAPDLAIAIVSSATHSENAPSSSKVKERQLFDVRAVRVPLLETSPNPSSTAFEISWHRKGTHIPLFTTYTHTRDAFLLVGGSSYQDAATPLVQPHEPTPDELAPIPRAGENFDGASSGPVQPYSWTQTDDTMTIAFALPGLTPKTTIHATFEGHNLSLRAGVPQLPQPLYTSAPLWDAILPSTSLWTWERGTATSAGLLTVHLDKAHPGMRWSHVFAQGFELHEVAETLDPSELASIRENLDKFTSSLQDGASGLGHGVPSLAEGERDNEVDSSVGHLVQLTWVANDGSASGPPDDTPAVLLSLPLPGIQDALSLVIKRDIDGILYTLDNTEWKHTATYPALGFVLASKRDTRFTFHVSSSATLAFESGARNNGGGNVYIYRGSTPGDKWAKQGVFQQQVDAGALLGVGVITTKAGQQSLLCLSERELTVCR
ncbi:hypothetical protein K439DRAFT_1283768, partial [Ramaria rubella]